MDRGKDHPEMSRKEKVQENAPSWVPFQVCRKRSNCQRTGYKENPNVRKTSHLLGRIILTNSESLHEGKICWNHQGDQKVPAQGAKVQEDTENNKDIFGAGIWCWRKLVNPRSP